MWSIDYIAKIVEDDEKSAEVETVEQATSPVETDKHKYVHKLSVQDSEETKSESEVRSESEVKSESDIKSESEIKSEETKTEDIEPCETEAAIKRVEALVKQMSLSQENGGKWPVIWDLLAGWFDYTVDPINRFILVLVS